MNGAYVDRNCAFIKMGGRLNIINEKFSKLLRYRRLAPDKLVGGNLQSLTDFSVCEAGIQMGQ